VSQPGDALVDRISRVGEVLDGKYELVCKLGQGGMGAVYEARHTFVGRRFAIKFLHPEMAGSPEMMARFRREAQTAGSLDCENVAAATDFGFASDGAPYIVMEMLKGEDLRALIAREGQLPVPRVINLAVQASRALEAAHGQGIVHRDLKPENLFITQHSDGSDLVKVLDFGIAKLRSGQSSGVSTQAGSMIGTLCYMPPEQLRGEKALDHRADVYALATIVYECLAGQLPHPGTEPHVVMYHILNEPPVPLDSLRAGLPPGFSEVVHQSLQADPAARHQSVRELTVALEQFARASAVPVPMAGDVPPELAETRATPPTSGPMLTPAAVAGAMTPGPATGEAPSRFEPTSEEPDGPRLTPGPSSVGHETQQALVASGLTPQSRKPPWLALGGGVLVLGVLVLVLWRPWSSGDAEPAASAAETAGALPAPPSAAEEVPEVVPASPVEAVETDTSEPADGRPSAEPDGSSEAPSSAPAPPARRPAAAKGKAKPAAAEAESSKKAADSEPAPTPTSTARTARGRKRAVEFERANPYQ